MEFMRSEQEVLAMVGVAAWSNRFETADVHAPVSSVCAEIRD